MFQISSSSEERFGRHRCVCIVEHLNFAASVLGPIKIFKTRESPGHTFNTRVGGIRQSGSAQSYSLHLPICVVLKIRNDSLDSLFPVIGILLARFFTTLTEDCPAFVNQDGLDIRASEVDSNGCLAHESYCPSERSQPPSTERICPVVNFE